MIGVVVNVIWQVALTGVFSLFLAVGVLSLLDVWLDRRDDKARERGEVRR